MAFLVVKDGPAETGLAVAACERLGEVAEVARL